MDCPRCNVEMSEITRDEGTLQRCADCGGLWVDVTDLNKILLHANLPALSALGGFVNADEITGMCPACNVDMVVVEGGEKRSVSYDTCESCGGIWVDGGDWNSVKDRKPEFFAATEAAHPGGKMGQVQDVANAVVFLASPAAGHISGANLAVDGGFLKRVNY